MRNFLIIIVFFCLSFSSLFSQQIQLDGMKNNFSKKEWFKMNGGFSASEVFYYANTPNDRDRFNYFLNGNINFRFFNLLNIPFSFNLTDTGSNCAYPTLPNRFSLHPSYKWATMHLGDVSMVFSPYTLNGHQFTGVGLELNPGKFKTSLMYGRMQRSVEYNPENSLVLAAYERMGCGAKVRYDADRFYVGTTAFAAKDDDQSLLWQPDSLGIRPQQNLATSIEAGVKLSKNFRLTGEYALSLLKRDIRADSVSSHQSYDAYKIGIDYSFLKNTVGLGYERIDPDYKTLGAYYFNNDYENITVNFTTLMLKDKLNLSTNVGVQRDDVENQKESKTNRFVGSVNLTYSPSQKLNFNLNYSNFQTHENVKSQFDYINQYAPTENQDTLNFTQLSHNASLSVMYQFKQTDTQIQNLNTNINYQVSEDQYGDIYTPDVTSRFMNASFSHSIQFIPKNTNLSTSVNVTNNNIATANLLMLGPSVSVSSKFLEKKLTTGFSTSYNWSFNEGTRERAIFNLRMNVGYLLLKKHNFTLSGICQRQDKTTGEDTYNFNSTLTYSYNF